MNYKEQISNLGVTVSFIAKKIGISRTLMSYYVNGTRDIPEDIERRLKNLLDALKKIAA